MHIGNIWSALGSWLFAKQAGGEWILRIEDIDRQRSKAEYAVGIQEDLRWLGFSWDGLYIQSERIERYEAALELLKEKDLLYPCYCSRARLHQVASAPHIGEAVSIYDRHCFYHREEAALHNTKCPSLRVHVPNKSIAFTDRIWGKIEGNLESICGDFIVKRSDGMYAYQLAVSVDDGENGVTQVVRGADLLSSTEQQIWLLEKFGYPAPEYIHLPLWVDETGNRLSKRQSGITVRELKSRGLKAEEILGMIAWSSRLIDKYNPLSLAELTKEADIKKITKEPLVWDNKILTTLDKRI